MTLHDDFGRSSASDSQDPWGQGKFARGRLHPRTSSGPTTTGYTLGEDIGSADREEVIEAVEERFGGVEEFVTRFLSPAVARRLGQSTALWCPNWWAHPEAVLRLTALWRAYEQARRDPDEGMSNWWLYHADPHLRALTDPDFGPFVLCDPAEGHTSRPLGPLPVRPAPGGVLDARFYRDV